MSWSWVLYVLILFGSNILGSVGGFGAGMISIPFLTQLFDAKLIIMASTVTCILNFYIAVENWKWIQWKKLWKIVVLMCIGLPFGVWILKILPVEILKFLLGIFMVLLGGYGLCKMKNRRLEEKKIALPVLYAGLILAGVIQGAISSGGSLVLLYAQQELPEKKSLRSTLALLWSAVSVIAVLQYWYAGTLTSQVFFMAGIGAPAVLAGIFAGSMLCRKLSQRTFQYIIYLLILAAGLMNCVGFLAG